jgi:sulfite reductase (NADPH) hemoprotein beta-component
VSEDDKQKIEEIAIRYCLMRDDVSLQRQDSMACVSLPTCPLAMAEAERYLPDAVSEIEAMLDKHGIGEQSIIYRITGCPNGCGRAMLAEIGLVGKGPNKYNLHLGGNREGTRIPRLYRENISDTEIMAILDELIGRWAKEQQPKEAFGDYVIRAGIIKPVIDSARDFYHELS